MRKSPCHPVTLPRTPAETEVLRFTIPPLEVDFHNWQQRYLARRNACLPDWGLEPEDMLLVWAAASLWTAAYISYLAAPADPHVRRSKQTVRQVLERHLRQIHQLQLLRTSVAAAAVGPGKPRLSHLRLKLACTD